MFKAKKLVIFLESAEVVGHLCNREGWIVDLAHIQQIKDWPPCESLSDVHAFLGTLGYVCIFNTLFAFLVALLVALMRKGAASI